MASSSISVAVRVRPATERERGQLQSHSGTSTAVFGDGCLSSTPTSSSVLATHRSSHSLRPIIKVLDQRVLIFDPPESNPVHQAQNQILARVGKKVKDMRFCFDRVFDERASQEDVYEGAAKDLVGGVLEGFNATVFAYGATGCGKTHTITGSQDDPGIVYLLMRDLFGRMEAKRDDMTVEVSISYLEIYNETIRDLLAPSSPPLTLREANSSVSVPGLCTETPTCASDVIRLISGGNAHRTVHGTDANAVSSRSHAVLSVNVRRKPRTEGLSEDWTVATLSVIDLAGSERASVTRNKGERLLEGANINRSLLALGNCINALCDPRKRNHVPYRDSKLTRLLKHSLGGNCRTLMIVCVAPTSAHYDETHNTLQYANRAKEIKTKATRNVISVDRHVSQYVQVIFQLREELDQRKRDEGERLDRAKKEWARSKEEVSTAVAKAKAHWAEATAKAVPAGKARGELRSLAKVDEALKAWRSAVDAGSYVWATTPLSTLAGEVEARRRVLEPSARGADAAMSMYEALVASLGRSVEAKAGSAERAKFEAEVNGGKSAWGLEGLGARAVEAAEREGEAEAAASMLVKVGAKVQDVVGGFVKALLGEGDETAQSKLLRFGERLDRANRDLFASLAPRSVPVAPSTYTLDSSSTGVAALPSNFFSLSPQKRDSDTALDGSRPLKTSRHASSSSSAPPPPSPVRQTYFAKRASPRKQVVFPSRAAGGGILKSRSNGRSPGKTRPKATVQIGGGGGVRWKDEEGEGWELESFDKTKEDQPDDEPSLDQSTLLPGSLVDPFQTASTSALAAPAPRVVIPSEEQPVTSGPGRASLGGRMKQGFLGRNRTVSRPTTLQSLGEEDEKASPVSGSTSTAFLATDPYARRALSEVANSSHVSSNSSLISDAGKPSTSSSSTSTTRGRTEKGGGDRRRTSSIGPMRTQRTNRRLSLTKPPPTAAPSSSSSTVAPPTNRSSNEPPTPRKSPKKGSSLRRGSLAVGGAGGGLSARPRRVSVMSAGAGSGSTSWQQQQAPSVAASGQVFGSSLRSDHLDGGGAGAGGAKGPVWR